MRRSASNAKLLQQHERRKASLEAKSSSTRFGAKQSRFQLRQEELRAQEALQSDAAVGGGRGAPAAATAQPIPAGTTTATTVGRFDRFGGDRPSQSRTTTSTTTATFGIAPPRRAGMHTVGSRSTRRVDKFRLADNNDSQTNNNNMSSTSRQLGTGLLGATRRPREEMENGDNGDNNKNNNNNNNNNRNYYGVEGNMIESEGPQRKKTREERFQEVMANSKDHRAQARRDREEREQQTTAIDAEFNDVMHLLQRRDRVQEERDAFAQSGTPQVRALLESFNANRVAKVLSLRNDGSFSVAPLTDTGAAGKKATTTTTTTKTVSKGERTQKDGSSFLDAADMALLQKVREGAIDKEMEAAVAAGTLPLPSSSSSQRVAEREETKGGNNTVSYTKNNMNNNEDADDFDRMMQSMRQETRRAHAADRTLTEEEEQQQQHQQALLESDRGAVPLVSQSDEQLTKAEWVSRGGDRAYQMDGDEDNDAEAEDDLDISSAYESDEAGDQQDGDISEEEDDEEGDESKTKADIGAPTSETATKREGGTGELEDVLAAMESLSRETNTSRASRLERGKTYHALLLRLYHYARKHVMHTAQTFRILLIDAQRAFLRSGTVDQTTLLLLHAASRIFPMTDYRHEVTTPFLLFLSSTLLQMRLTTFDHVRVYAVLAGLLCNSVVAGGKFCAEAIIAPLNIISLLLPRVVLEPVRLQGVCVPFPLLDRGGSDTEAFLSLHQAQPQQQEKHSKNKNSKSTSAGATTTTTTGGEKDIEEKEEEKVQEEEEPLLQATLAVLETDVRASCIVRYAYRLLAVLADTYRTIPAFSSCLLEPFLALHERLASSHVWETLDSNSKSTTTTTTTTTNSSSAIVVAAVRRDHDALLARLTEHADAMRDRRTPLAMRSFRPRPIRQYEPLLQESQTGTSALKREVREMRREVREDRKRLVRHLQAEAHVERRQREHVVAATEEERGRKYRELMGALQSQQHVMNTVDGLLSKARSKKRRGMTGQAGREDDGDDNNNNSSTAAL